MSNNQEPATAIFPPMRMLQRFASCLRMDLPFSDEWAGIVHFLYMHSENKFSGLINNKILQEVAERLMQSTDNSNPEHGEGMSPPSISNSESISNNDIGPPSTSSNIDHYLQQRLHDSNNMREI